MMTMRVRKVVRRVVMTMRKVVRAMRREENTTTRDSLASEGERPRGRLVVSGAIKRQIRFLRFSEIKL